MQRQARVAPAVIAIALACTTTTESRADPASDAKLSYLEQQVHDLRNQLMRASRRLDALEGAMTKSRAASMAQPPTAAPAVASAPAVTTAWLESEQWDKLRPGLPEATVVDTLGPPTTIRTTGDGGTRTLFYSLELEAGGFLSGRVIIADRRVVEIHRPELR